MGRQCPRCGMELARGAHCVCFVFRELDEMPWAKDAACAASTVNPDWFHVDVGESVNPAKNVCAVCPVAEECLRFAVKHKEIYGVWGGTTFMQRRRLHAVSEPLLTRLIHDHLDILRFRTCKRCKEKRKRQDFAGPGKRICNHCLRRAA